MSEKLHTPEPWIEAGPSYGKPHPVEINSIVPVNIEEGELVEDICTFDHSNNHEQNAANARRIVACVNACAGISTEVLEAPGPGIETAKQIVKENELLTAQRDSLLSALRALYGWQRAEVEHFGATTPDDFIIEMVEKAIKNA